jgi:hypothetical protein
MESKTEKESKKTCLEISPKTRRLLRDYYNILDRLGIKSVERGTRLQHMKWMCGFAENGIEDEVKANRWLGWIQGWLVVENIFGLEEVMDHSRNGRIGKKNE